MSAQSKLTKTGRVWYRRNAFWPLKGLLLILVLIGARIPLNPTALPVVASEYFFLLEKQPVDRFIPQAAPAIAISTEGNDQLQPAIAYNSQADEYLVVWEHEQTAANHDIHARRVDRSGNPIGAIFAVKTHTNSDSKPAIAYNSVVNEYLVVWEYAYSATDHDIHARRVAANGDLLGNELVITSFVANESSPDIAYNPSTNEYLVVWERYVPGELPHHDLYARRVAATGTPLDSINTVANSTLEDEAIPAVAYGGSYLVVWQSQHAEVLAYDIQGQRLADNGTLLGSRIFISTRHYDQLKPRLAFNNTGNEFLVVWEDHYEGSGADWDVYGQRINASGTLVGGNFSISWLGANQRLNPDVIYQPAANEYLVAWEFEQTAANHNLHYRRVSSNGSLPTDEIDLSTQSLTETQPALASNGNWSALAVWEDGRNAEAQGLDIYGSQVVPWGLSGTVYEGDVGNESNPLADVTVELYCSNNAAELGPQVASVTTDAAGRYSLPLSQVCEYYNLVETDLPGYSSTGAMSTGGTVVNPNWIQYVWPLAGKPLPGNNFWDSAASNPQVEALRQLETASQREPFIQFEQGLLRFAAVKVPVPDDLPDDPVVQTLDFLDRYQDLYRLVDPGTQLYLNRIVSDERGNQHLFYGQHQDGIPVFGAELAVHLEDEAVTATGGKYLPEIPALPPATISAPEAETIAINELPGYEIETTGETKLMIFNGDLIGTGDSEIHLAWQVSLSGLRTSDNFPAWWTAFVDAHNGRFLYSIDWDVEADRPGEDFDIETANHDTSISCWIMTDNDDQWFDEDGPTSGYPGTYPGGDTDGDKAYTYTHQLYHFYYDNFGRRSYDGDEEDVEVYVHWDSDKKRSHYVLNCDIFEFADKMVTLDLFAHEFTHGVTFSSAGLIYANQSGALNESYSDVFGAIVDDANWTIGEGSAGGVSRDLSSNTPDHYSNYYHTTDDHGGVHTNCNITNRAAYLIAEGGTHYGITVPGMGRDKLARLYFDVLTTRLAKNATFKDVRNVTVDQARVYLNNGQYGFLSVDVCTVINAFAAVGLGPQDLDCDGLDDYEDLDDDGDYVRDSEDNCRQVANPDQENMDHDSTGDACDPDIDGDGRVNGADNCPYVANPDQADSDHDGAGEVCDDDDGDDVTNTEDNCPSTYNYFQEDNDGDGTGDACDNDDDNDGLADASDNCPFVSNVNQADADGDNVGNACDNCPNTASSNQSDVDFDGLGDVCDPDDDDDGVPDGDDNCPKDRNPWQTDLDGDGKGTTCDQNELDKLSPLNKIDGLIDFKADVVRFPIFPCLQCPDWLPERYETSVAVALPLDLPARIVDDQGIVVSKSGPGLEKLLHFHPSADFTYRPPIGELSTSDNGVYRGRNYFLEIYRSPEVETGQDYPIEISVGHEQLIFRDIYLPAIFKSKH